MSVATQLIGHDLVIYVDVAIVLVSSESTPGSWQVVEDLSRCSCDGFAYRGSCRHLAEAREAAQRADPGPTEPARRYCAKCGVVPLSAHDDPWCRQCQTDSEPKLPAVEAWTSGEFASLPYGTIVGALPETDDDHVRGFVPQCRRCQKRRVSQHGQLCSGCYLMPDPE